MNVTLWDTSSDVRKELSIQDDRTESDNRIEVMLLIGIAENNLPHIARWESTKPPYAEPHVRWCGRSVNVKIGGKCLLWLAFTSYPIVRSAWALSNGCKSRVSPNSGNYIAKGKGVHRELESERSRRQTSDLTDRNFIQGIWPWVRLQNKPKPYSYPERSVEFPWACEKMKWV